MSSRAVIDKHDAKIDASCTKFIAMISNIIVCYIIYLCNVCHTYYISKKKYCNNGWNIHVGTHDTARKFARLARAVSTCKISKNIKYHIISAYFLHSPRRGLRQIKYRSWGMQGFNRRPQMWHRIQKARWKRKKNLQKNKTKQEANY